MSDVVLAGWMCLIITYSGQLRGVLISRIIVNVLDIQRVDLGFINLAIMLIIS